jgi:putative ABC transport system permease protein
MREFRLAIRAALQQPLFTAVVVTMLSVGVGGATAMFSAVRGVLLKPLSYERPDELVWMFGAFRVADSAAVSPPDFLDYRDRNRVFQSLGAMVIGPSAVTVAGSSGPERFNAASVSAGLITTLGIPPLIGRDFHVEEERDRGGLAVIISERLWREQFEGSPDVLGQAMRIDQTSRTIVGVMPAGFSLPFDSFIRLTDPVDLYLPVAFDRAENQVRRFHFLRLIGRLEPGVTMREAQSQMDTIARQLEEAYPENETWKLRLVPLHEQLVGDMRQVLIVLMGAVVLLLVVACANVAGLLLARGVARRPEISLRMALGASRGRVIGQMLMEALVLALMGGVGGMLLALWLVQLMKRLGPPDLPRLTEIGVDWVVIVFAAAQAGLAALLSSAGPAVLATESGTADALTQASRTIGRGPRSRVRMALVTAQIAFSCTLVAVAGLFVQSLLRLQTVDPGFSTRGVVLSHISLPPDNFDSEQRVAAWLDSLLERLSAVPAVEAAGLASAPPLVGAGDTAVHPEGSPPVSDKDRRFAQLRYADGGYFSTLGIRVISGRTFTSSDRAGAPPVAVISRRMADDFFPGQNPVGRRLVVDRGERTVAEIVGMVGDARLFGQAEEPPATVYLATRQFPAPATHVVLRLADISHVDALLRATVRSLDPTVAVGRVQLLQTLLDESLAQPRFRTALIVLFASVALLLTLGGLFGTVSWVVAQRTRELGIRCALGARPRQLLNTVLGEGVWILAAGTVIGVAGGVAAGRFVRGLLFGAEPFEPAILLTAAGGLAVSGFLAMIVPAVRAGRVDPALILRSE